MTTTLNALTRLQRALTTLGVDVPEPITKGFAAVRAAQAATVLPPAENVLDLDQDSIRARVEAFTLRGHATRAGAVGLEPGISAFTQEVLTEVTAQVQPYLDDLIAGQQEAFAKAATPLVVGAQKFGFTLRTTSDQVIDLADDEAPAAWRNARDAWQAMRPFVELRKAVSVAFALTPVREVGCDLPGDNWSVCFAAGDNWGLTLHAYKAMGRWDSGLDWLALAKDGLRLNTPTEVAAKVAARGH